MSISGPRGGVPKRSSTVLVSHLTIQPPTHCTPTGPRFRFSLSWSIQLACCSRLTPVAYRLPIRAMGHPRRTVPRRNAKALVASSLLTTYCSMLQISRLRSAVRYPARVRLNIPVRLLGNTP
jgi:hypothetical protein